MAASGRNGTGPRRATKRDGNGRQHTDDGNSAGSCARSQPTATAQLAADAVSAQKTVVEKAIDTADEAAGRPARRCVSRAGAEVNQVALRERSGAPTDGQTGEAARHDARTVPGSAVLLRAKTRKTKSEIAEEAGHSPGSLVTFSPSTSHGALIAWSGAMRRRIES